MQTAQTIRTSNTSQVVWIELPVKAATPLLVATCIAIGATVANFSMAPISGAKVTEAGPSNLKSFTFRSDGDVMAKNIDKSSPTNGAFTIDPLDYGKLLQQVENINQALEKVTQRLNDLPTKDWVEKTLLQEQVNKVNKNTNTRIAIFSVAVTVVTAVISYLLPKMFG